MKIDHMHMYDMIMAFENTTNKGSSNETQREYPPVLRTPSVRGNKLLVDAERVAKGLSGQRVGLLHPEVGNNSRDVIVRYRESHLEKLT